MGEENSFQGIQRRRSGCCRRLQSRGEGPGRPCHDGFPDCFLAGEMAEKGALGQSHALRYGGGGDLRGVPLRCESEDGFHDDGPPFLRGKIFSVRCHKAAPSPFYKIVIGYYLTLQLPSCQERSNHQDPQEAGSVPDKKRHSRCRDKSQIWKPPRLCAKMRSLRLEGFLRPSKVNFISSY